MKCTPTLRKWVEASMQDRGWNAAMLAEASGISHATLSRFFQKRYRTLSPPTVAALCRVFEVSEMELYRIAHNIPDPMPDPEIRDLAIWLHEVPQAARASVLKAAGRHGWQSKGNHPRKAAIGGLR